MSVVHSRPSGSLASPAAPQFIRSLSVDEYDDDGVVEVSAEVESIEKKKIEVQKMKTINAFVLEQEEEDLFLSL